MTDTGLACVFSVEPNVPIEIADFPLPEVEPDAILVRMTIANICGSDLHVWRGEMSAPFETAPPGYGSGHEGTGQVARLGSNINTDSLGRPIQEGDRVVFAYFSLATAAMPAWMTGPTPALPGAVDSVQERLPNHHTSPARSLNTITCDPAITSSRPPTT